MKVKIFLNSIIKYGAFKTQKPDPEIWLFFTIMLNIFNVRDHRDREHARDPAQPGLLLLPRVSHQ